jgi:hypothetical protein
MNPKLIAVMALKKKKKKKKIFPPIGLSLFSFASQPMVLGGY